MAAKSAGYSGVIDEEEEGEAEEENEEVGRVRKKGREGPKRRKGGNNDNQTRKIRKKKTTPKKRETVNIQHDKDLEKSGPSQDLTPDEQLTKARSKEGKRKSKK